MSRTILALSTVALLCASSQIAFADESGAITGGVGAQSPVLLLAVRSARSWGGGGAAIGNSMTNHRGFVTAGSACWTLVGALAKGHEENQLRGISVPA
jgi:hypothetical protein